MPIMNHPQYIPISHNITMGGIQIPIPGVSRPRQPVAEADGHGAHGAHSRAATHAASGDAGPQRRFQSRRRRNPRGFPKLGIHGVQESATKSEFIDTQPDQPDQEWFKHFTATSSIGPSSCSECTERIAALGDLESAGRLPMFVPRRGAVQIFGPMQWDPPKFQRRAIGGTESHQRMPICRALAGYLMLFGYGCWMVLVQWDPDEIHRNPIYLEFIWIYFWIFFPSKYGAYGALLQHVDVADPKIGCLQLVLLVKSVEVPIWN